MTIFRQAGLPHIGVAPSLDGATGWLNSPPLVPEKLAGRVVLYIFWTYTCINWLRTLPFVRAWEAKYREHGLVVVGVHTPEFAFEKEIDNVGRAVHAQDVVFAVVLDSEYAIWRAFDNHYWPALYLADVDGSIRYEHFGEGRNINTERAIQELLTEAGKADIDHNLVAPSPTGVETPAAWNDLETPESYLDEAREGLVVPSVRMRFHARDVNLVMTPVDPNVPVRFRVTLDAEGLLDAPRPTQSGSEANSAHGPASLPHFGCRGSRPGGAGGVRRLGNRMRRGPQRRRRRTRSGSAVRAASQSAGVGPGVGGG